MAMRGSLSPDPAVFLSHGQAVDAHRLYKLDEDTMKLKIPLDSK